MLHGIAVLKCFTKFKRYEKGKKKINQKIIPSETLSYNFANFFSFFNRATPRDFFWIYLQDVMILSVKTSFIKKLVIFIIFTPVKVNFEKATPKLNNEDDKQLNITVTSH